MYLRKDTQGYLYKKKLSIFLDRDGVINKDSGYVYQIKDFILYEDAINLINFYGSQNIPIFVVTNQSGIGRGYYSLEEFYNLNKYFLNKFDEKVRKNIFINFCPHDPKLKCSCRKPNTYMIRRFIKRFSINLSNSIMVGDKLTDLKAAWRSKIKKIYYINRDNDFSELSKLSSQMLEKITAINSLNQLIDKIG